MSEICWRVWGTPANFNGLCVLALLLQWRCSPEANQTLHDFRGLLSPDGIFTGANFTFCPSLTFSYIGNVTARHLSSGRQPNFAALNRGRHLYPARRPLRRALVHISSTYCCTAHYIVCWYIWVVYLQVIRPSPMAEIMLIANQILCRQLVLSSRELPDRSALVRPSLVLRLGGKSSRSC